MEYIVYKTINKINNKFYIGVHKTENSKIFDGYIGCGIYINKAKYIKSPNTHFLKAIKKYGTDNFYRVVLKSFNNYNDALDLERWLVTEKFIKDNNNYNSAIGGGLPPKNNIEIYQYDLNGKLIKKWGSTVDINNAFKSHIQMSDIINNRRSFAGFLWSFNNNININDYILHNNRGFISQYDSKFNFIRKFKSSKEASKILNIPLRSIISSVFRRKKIDSFYFLKADFDINELFKDEINYVYRQTKIFQYNNDGNFINVYKSFLNCSKELNLSYNKIKEIINKKEKFNNYYLSYRYDTSYFNIKSPNKKVIINVLQYDKNNQFIREWNDIKQLLKEYPEALKVCRNKLKTYKNYIFKYKII